MQKKIEELVNHRISKIKNTLAEKTKEYGHNGVQLHNFKVAARINNTTPQKALWGMASKHLVSVIDLIDGNLESTAEMIDSKIGDMINYLILLEILLLDKNKT